MPVSNQDLQNLTGLLLAMAPGVNPLPRLREQIRDLTITRVEAEDMRGETPFRRLPGYDLYLIDARQHCWTLVSDLDHASGVIVSPRAG